MSLLSPITISAVCCAALMVYLCCIRRNGETSCEGADLEAGDDGGGDGDDDDGDDDDDDVHVREEDQRDQDLEDPVIISPSSCAMAERRRGAPHSLASRNMTECQEPLDLPSISSAGGSAFLSCQYNASLSLLYLHWLRSHLSSLFFRRCIAGISTSVGRRVFCK